jgi:hypothetical protein
MHSITLSHQVGWFNGNEVNVYIWGSKDQASQVAYLWSMMVFWPYVPYKTRLLHVGAYLSPFKYLDYVAYFTIKICLLQLKL